MIIATCDLENYNFNDQTCALVVFKEMDSFLPPLSVADASFIGGAIVACWCLGYGFKLVRKFLMR